MQQFTPHSWTPFLWATTKSFKNFISVIILLYLGLQCELNIFYLKYLLWIPVDHPYLKIRLVLFFFFALPAVRELYQYVSDSRCKQLGAHAWMLAATIICELFVCIKFGRNEFQKPAPPQVILGWIVGIGILILYIVHKFISPEIKSRRLRRQIFGTSSPIGSPILTRSRSKILENKLD
jgi:phosphatidylserine synthase 2